MEIYKGLKIRIFWCSVIYNSENLIMVRKFIYKGMVKLWYKCIVENFVDIKVIED